MSGPTDRRKPEPAIYGRVSRTTPAHCDGTAVGWRGHDPRCSGHHDYMESADRRVRYRVCLDGEGFPLGCEVLG